jgi:hypothetical protein
MPDPVLKTAVEEIKAVLVKHDIAAVVFLGSNTHTEFVYELSPSWSCARELPDGGGLRIRSKRSEYATKEAQFEELRLTVGMIMGFIDAIEHTKSNLGAVMMMLATHMDISHFSKLDDPPESDISRS